ncbi:MAG: TRAP transporter small permease [Minwuia sp.]|uniref:TRAP transporter small permease n=1 Tax=Minwuia sp. TaxID=2493630 RepID=UPI003A8A54B6
MTRWSGRCLRHLTSGLAIAAEIFVALMMLHIAFEVTMRYVFGISVPGTLTFVSKYYLPAVVFLPLAIAERRNNHISVEVLTQYMPRPAQKGLEIFAWLLAAVVFAVLAYQTLLDALKKTRFGAFELDFGYQFITWPSYYILPIGFTAVALVLLYRALITVLRAPDDLGFEQSDEPAETAVPKNR